MSQPTTDDVWDRALARMQESLGPDGWTVYRSRRGVKARWRWLSVRLEHDPSVDAPWRARLRDGFPRKTVAEHQAHDALDALAPVIAHAREVARFCDGRLGLVRNPSKSWMQHRIWQAVRPADNKVPQS